MCQDLLPDPVAPDWFSAAIGTSPEVGVTAASGTPIAWRAWGEAGRPGVVLLHGGAAHARWWDHVAPLLVEGHRRVVAVDLAGHGESGHRDCYELDAWAADVAAAAKDGGIEGSAVVVGHSMGGFVALRVAASLAMDLIGVVVVDSPVRDLTLEERMTRTGRTPQQPRVYATREAAMSRFRPIPDQPVLPYVASYVAENSVRRVQGGWSWKFDSRIFGREHLSLRDLGPLECRVALVRGEQGLLSPPMSEAIYERLGRVAPQIEIAGAGHHIMLDQPLALIGAMRTLLADWSHSHALLPRDRVAPHRTAR